MFWINQGITKSTTKVKQIKPFSFQISLQNDKEKFLDHSLSGRKQVMWLQSTITKGEYFTHFHIRCFI